MELDDFSERLIWIVNEIRGSDTRAEHRLEQLVWLAARALPEFETEAHEIIADELYKAIYEDKTI